MDLRSKIPEKPADFDGHKLFDAVHWHQLWEIYQGVWTPGRNPVKELMDYARVPQDLSGKSVLDIGAWNGCFSCECIRRGAKFVLGLGPDDAEVGGFNRLKRELGYGNLDYVKGSVYDLDKSVLGEFDVVLFLGVIYHLRYPLLALDKIWDVCRQSLFVESFVIDNAFFLAQSRVPVQLQTVSPVLSDTPIWEFFQHDELNGDSSNWFGPNTRALVAAIESAGFSVTHTASWGHRSAVAATKTEREFLKSQSYEADQTVGKSVKLKV